MTPLMTGPEGLGHEAEGDLVADMERTHDLRIRSGSMLHGAFRGVAMRRDEGSVASARRDHPGFFEFAIGARNGSGSRSQLSGQSTNRRQACIDGQ